ncbi:hypothetical protein ACIA8F_38720 [Streptomyces sp. NPDC051563]|uniref:hypothetical protein n=1 Tax=Streptomyces sp. NPDC051563 TaxID=3365659 RepID=UPI00379AB64C
MPATRPPDPDARPPDLDPRVCEIIDDIVKAVRRGDDAAVRTPLANLAAVADITALLYLRERLYPPP